MTKKNKLIGLARNEAGIESIILLDGTVVRVQKGTMVLQQNDVDSGNPILFVVHRNESKQETTRYIFENLAGVTWANPR